MWTGWCLTLDDYILSLLRLLASCWLMSKPRIGLLLPSFVAWPAAWLYLCMVQAALLCKRATEECAVKGPWCWEIGAIISLSCSSRLFFYSKYFSLSCVYWLFGYFELVHSRTTGSEENRPILLSYTAVNNVQPCHDVDRAHPDGGLLSPSVVHPACEQSQHGRKGTWDRGQGAQLSLCYT